MIATSTSAKKASAAAEAVGAKAARACDGCLRRRARWYCAADDAFLCQGCDTSVHSANPLARRHERLRLRPTSPPLSASPPPPAKREPSAAPGDEVVPAWFRRKARTPRGGHAKSVSSRRLVVPESNGEGEAVEEEEEEEEQLLYRVPIFDPTLVAEFSSPPPPPPPLEDAAATAVASPCSVEDTAKPDAPVQLSFTDGGHGSFEPTDAELREFAADMEALLGRGLDDGNEEDSSFYMETLGLLDPVDDDEAAALVKFQIDGGSETSGGTLLACGGGGLELEMEMEAEASDQMLDIDFDYGSPHQHETTHGDEKSASSGTSAQFLQRSLSLTLNYEAIIQSWGSSPWTAGGERPLVKLDHSWPHDYTGAMWVVGGVVGHGGEELGTPRLGMTMDGGREARVSRYREKRRTRLFAKKIRYEVRKLNAEKRPRMKGRFVKRANTTEASVVAVAGLA
ncbi:hypothetical protein HU200_063929 [Digitaria exilis]|uniref:Uncharacterized protein n=1 Tax=Digitaria exilis TaxID=1010633 RepID=A0A835A6H3_9POAL|nr:hypothetical protein HU200_063929 [Digitaria exilis]CAB3470251.1 unnamed protein product [Digitaria exilis]